MNHRPIHGHQKFGPKQLSSFATESPNQRTFRGAVGMSQIAKKQKSRMQAALKKSVHRATVG
jgi:hypothetical protein